MKPSLFLDWDDFPRFLNSFSDVSEFRREKPFPDLNTYHIVRPHSVISAEIVLEYSVVDCDILDYTLNNLRFKSEYDFALFEDFGDGGYLYDFDEFVALDNIDDPDHNFYHYARDLSEQDLYMLDERFPRWPGKFKKILKKAEKFGYSFRELIHNFHDELFFHSFMDQDIDTRAKLDEVLSKSTQRKMKVSKRI